MNSSFGARARLFTVAIACILLCAAGSPDGAGTARADDLPDCRAGAVVIVAGTNDVGAPSQLGVQQRYTGESPADGTYAGQNEYKVIKPDYPTTLWPIGTVGYDDDVARGTAATAAAIAEYQRECPGKEVVVVGYSQGARVAGDVLNQVATSAETTTDNGITYKKVVIDGQEYWISQENMRGELYSDPRRDGPESGRGIELSFLGVIPGLTMNGARPGGFGTIPVTSYCYQGDPICDLPDPLHDPFGAIDGFVGYFVKHGYYPWRMYQPVTGDAWNCVSKTPNADGYIDCVVPAPSSISLVRRDVINGVRGLVGLPPRQVLDLWSALPDIDGIFPHANLSDLQKYLTPVLAVLPQLPNLGYGGYLPDVFVFTGLLDGLARIDVDAIGASLEALGKSALSIATMPVNAVKSAASGALDGRTARTAESAGPQVAEQDAVGDTPTALRLETPSSAPDRTRSVPRRDSPTRHRETAVQDSGSVTGGGGSVTGGGGSVTDGDGTVTGGDGTVTGGDGTVTGGGGSPAEASNDPADVRTVIG